MTIVLDTDTVTFGAQNLSFGRPVAPLWHPGGPWDDPGDNLGAQERRPWGPGLDDGKHSLE